MMKSLITGLMAAVLIGCSSLLKLDKSEVRQPPIPTATEEPDAAINAPVLQPELEPKPTRKPAQIQVPTETPESIIFKPCRNIEDEDLWRELRLKLTCIEETVKK
jgi:hypothetical protein